jgi:hypothetical protein
VAVPDQEELEQLSKRSMRAFRVIIAILAVTVLGLMAGVIYLLTSQSSTVRAATDGDCAFYQLISELPVVVHPTKISPVTSRLGVELVEDARRAYTRGTCQPSLPPPGPNLTYLARVYDIKLVY